MATRISTNGNTFLVARDITPDKAKGIAAGIKEDGLLVLEESLSAAARLRLYEHDGTESALCGNGLLCVARLLMNGRCMPAEITLEMDGHLIPAWTDGETTRVGMPHPQDAGKYLKGGEGYRTRQLAPNLFFLNVGEPHLIKVAQEVNEAQTSLVELAHNKAMFPQGTNFSVLTLGSKTAIRTYERGVNGWTRSCGTAAVAAAHLIQQLFGTTSLTVSSPGGEHNVTITEKHTILEGKPVLHAVVIG